MKFSIPYIINGTLILAAAAPGLGNTNPDDDAGVPKTFATNIIDNTHTDADDTIMAFTTPYAIGAVAARNDVIYTLNDGRQYTRTGGTRAWRNNNPGCIRYGQFARNTGAIGSAGGFAVFSDEATGMAAIYKLLRSETYINLTIAQVIAKYAPPHENDTGVYKNKIKNLTKLNIDMQIRSLTDEQLKRVVHAIKTIEGWIPGYETQPAYTTIAAERNMAQIARDSLIRDKMTRSM